MEDHSDVVVALYELVSIDSQIEEINRGFPSVGIVLSQETEFDHRLQSPTKYTYTGVDGSFRLENIKAGRYNLAFLKEGFSVRYVYELSLKNGDNALPEGQVVLSQIVTMPQAVTTPFTFESGVQYYFPLNAVITAPVTVNSGAILAIEAGRRVDFHGMALSSIKGEVSSFSKFRWLTSAYSLNSLQSQSPQMLEPNLYFDRVNIYSTEYLDISDFKLSFANSGMVISAPLAKIEKSYFSQNNTALVINGGEVTIQNIFHKDSKNRSIDFAQNHAFNGNEILYRDNISKNNLIGLYCSIMPLKIENNFMVSNETAVYVWDGQLEATGNTFIENHRTIENLGSYATIRYNDFKGSGFVDIIFGESRGNRANGTINFNNFYETRNFYFRMTTSNGLIAVVGDIDATNNYFINNNIDPQIWDKHDNANLLYEFVYIPRAMSEFNK